VYGWTGKNFMRRILELAHEREELSIVSDQFVSPTPAAAIAEATVQALGTLTSDRPEPAYGTYHLTAAGQTSWYDFARAILARDPERARQRCKLIRPVSTPEFPQQAKRPANGVLDNAKFERRFGVRIPGWERELDRTFGDRPNTR
jgi:dTDP-4-dehydrorhamnose reductase